jgi:glycosyltransferase involved in cell wall biosynthesis
MHPLQLSPEIQPYIALLAAALRQQGVDVVEYRTIDVLRRPPDIIHFHWPEHTLNRPPLRRWMRGLLLLSTLRVARLRGAVLVLTAHNASPHDLNLDRFGAWFIRCFDHLVDGVLVLSRRGWTEVVRERPGLADSVVTHTRHGDFRSAYPASLPPGEARREIGLDPAARAVVFAGQVRRYKGVPDLLEAARELDLQVVVAGVCDDVALRTELERSADADPRLHLRLGHLSSSELSRIVSAGTAVVLPYRRVLNSGSALLALSLSRPVILPDTPTFRELQTEVGHRWVRLFDGGRLTADSLEVALADPPSGSPDLTRYEWDTVANATIAGYQRTREHRRRSTLGERSRRRQRDKSSPQ